VSELQTRGRRLLIEELGAGEPAVLLLPGLLQSSRDWVRSGVAPALAQRWRVILFDPLGHGGSDRPHDAGAYGEEGLVEDVISVLDAAGVERVALWGWSRGARMAYATAFAHPERVAALVAGGQPLRSALETSSRLTRLAAALADDPDRFFEEIGVGSAAAREYLLANNDLEAILAALRGQARQPIEIDLASLSAPVLLYSGADDPAREEVERTAERLGAPLAVFEGLDHGGMFLRSRQLLPRIEELLGSVVPTR